MSCSSRRIYALKSDDTSCVYGAGMKPGSDAKHVTKGTAKSSKIKGICQTEAGQVSAVEDPLEIALPGGGAMALLNGTVTDGNELTFDGTGYVEAASGDFVSAKAMQGGVSGDLVAVEVMAYFKA